MGCENYIPVDDEECVPWWAVSVSLSVCFSDSGSCPSSRSMVWVCWVAMQDLQRRVNMERNDFLARFAGNLDSSVQDGNLVKIVDRLKSPEKDYPSLRRLPTGAAKAVTLFSFSLGG